MPQVKKAGMREAIIAAAFELFRRKSYTRTTMSEIARASHMTVANLYVYFDSKLLILYEIYAPWLKCELARLRQAVDREASPRAKLRRILVGIWSEIPAADHAFANALIEALAGAPPGMEKPVKLLDAVEGFLTEMLLDALPAERAAVASDRLLSHIMWMAFDGFVVNQRIGDVHEIGSIADLMTDLLLAEGIAHC